MEFIAFTASLPLHTDVRRSSSPFYDCVFRLNIEGNSRYSKDGHDYETTGAEDIGYVELVETPDKVSSAISMRFPLEQWPGVDEVLCWIEEIGIIRFTAVFPGKSPIDMSVADFRARMDQLVT